MLDVTDMCIWQGCDHNNFLSSRCAWRGRSKGHCCGKRAALLRVPLRGPCLRVYVLPHHFVLGCTELEILPFVSRVHMSVTVFDDTLFFIVFFYCTQQFNGALNGYFFVYTSTYTLVSCVHTGAWYGTSRWTSSRRSRAF